MNERIVNNVQLTGIALAFTGLAKVICNIVIGRNFGAEPLGQANL
jgi:hypothetical protein